MRRRGLACAPGWLPLLGERRHHRLAERRRRAARLRESHARPDRAPPGGTGSAGDGRAVAAAGGRREGVCAAHARSRRAGGELERGGRAHRGVLGPGDSWTAHFPVLSAAGCAGGQSRAGAAGSRGGGAVGRRRVASPQGRLPLLGERRHHRLAEHRRRAARFCQAHPRPHRAAPDGNGATAKRGAAPPDGGECEGLRDPRARPRGTSHQLEHRCRTDRGIPYGGDSRPTLLPLLSGGGRGSGKAGVGARAGGQGRAVRRRRVAGAKTAPASGPTW